MTNPRTGKEVNSCMEVESRWHIGYNVERINNFKK